MSILIDPVLGGPSGRGRPPVLGGAESPLARASAAAARPFLVEGERLAVSGSEIAGRHTVWLGARAVVRDLEAGGGLAANVVASPGTLLRELVGSGGSLHESTLVAPSLPLAAIQWRRPPGGGRPATLGIALTVLPGEDKVRYCVGEAGARFAGVGADGVRVEVLVHPPPLEVSVGERVAGGAELRVAVEMDGAVTLLVAAGTGEAAARALQAASHLSAHEASAAREWDPARMETLSALTGVLEVDHAVAWASARVHGSLLRGASTDPGAIFWAGMGAVAVGDAEAAARGVEALAASPDSAAEAWPVGGRVHTGLLGTLLAARLTLLTGDPDPALAALRRLPSGPPSAGGAAGLGASGEGAWQIARDALADALRHAAPASGVAALRTRPSPWRIVGGRASLPMAGASPQPALSPLPWTAWSEGDPDRAWASWRQTLAEGLEGGGPWGRGSWPWEPSPGSPSPGDPPSHGPHAPEQGAAAGAGAGRVLCSFAHGLLGVSPDAPSHRIGLAPALPAHLTRFSARHIRVGDVRLTLEYRREGTVHTFTLDPVEGRVPAMVVLEPSLPTPRVGVVRVDGALAQLDVASRGRRSVVRVQFPLDASRRLEIEDGG